jgi:hypothetical protein
MHACELEKSPTATNSSRPHTSIEIGDGIYLNAQGVSSKISTCDEICALRKVKRKPRSMKIVAFL